MPDGDGDMNSFGAEYEVIQSIYKSVIMGIPWESSGIEDVPRNRKMWDKAVQENEDARARGTWLQMPPDLL